ncbi:pleiotropic regulatory protein RsmS [Vibrio splendidus]|nr:pleiotropic regulatory protein RsmS [Vibrio splendidus]MCC4860302.1 pleiotropic regulatory protein RsmS [Vibrio splendidus]
MNTDNTSSPLDNAPEEVKLAVDLIYLLESNEIDPKVALEAIKIVQQDLQAKLASSIQDSHAPT